MLGLVSLGLFALGVGLSLLAAYLLRPKIKSQDAPPTALSVRGAYIPWIMGRCRVKPIFGWAGHRFRRRERAHSGKGGSMFKPKIKIYYEEGWHILSIGPVTALYGIYEGKRALFEGVLTPESHPSGSLLDLGKQGQARIYWGETTQPVNTVLGDSSRVGISSRWPGICYIHWEEKRLGESPIWPMLEYWIERRPTGNYLSNSDAWRNPTFTLSGVSHLVYDAHMGIEGVGYITVQAVAHGEFEPLGKFKATGLTALSDGDYEIVKVEEFYYSHNGELWVKVYPEGGVSTSVSVETGNVEVYARGEDMGANPAHVIADLLFESWPYGLSQKEEYWDMDSLEDLGVLLEDEDWFTHWEATEGKTAKDLLGEALQDIGAVVYQNPITGLLTFKALRKATGTLFNIDKDMILPPLPEVESVMDAVKAKKVIYSYKDVELGYRPMTITIDDDGQASFLDYQNATQSTITLADFFDMAAKIAERRSQEELGNGALLRLKTNRSTRTLVPGEALTVEGFEEIFRVVELELNPDSGIIELHLMADFYGAEDSTFENRPGKDVIDESATQLNPLQTFIEIPEFIVGKSLDLKIIAPIVRADYQTFNEMLYLSDDGTSYTLFGEYDDFVAGGVLDSALPNNGIFYLEQGPTFTVSGPDISQVLDLSGSESEWRKGRQLCLIGEELCFLKKVTAMGGNTYRLDGLLRARYDTRQETHAIGDGIFIFTNEAFNPIMDLLLGIGEDLYLKPQPIGFAGELPLDLVPEIKKTLYGKGVVPMPPETLRVTAPVKNVPAYSSGNNITFQWCYLSTLAVGSGAGMQGYGEVCGEAEVDGNFRVEILDSLN
ncbi:hypothetical protein DRJ22_06410, partial [Candidatus Woesearchaeota archaeon]